MRKFDDLEALDVLTCEIGLRPKDAPTFEDLAPRIRAVRRETDSVVVEFDREAAREARALVEAERQCCRDIGWNLRAGARVELEITALPNQLDTLYQMLTRGA